MKGMSNFLQEIHNQVERCASLVFFQHPTFIVSVFCCISPYLTSSTSLSILDGYCLTLCDNMASRMRSIDKGHTPMHQQSWNTRVYTAQQVKICPKCENMQKTYVPGKLAECMRKNWNMRNMRNKLYIYIYIGGEAYRHVTKLCRIAKKITRTDTFIFWKRRKLSRSVTYSRRQWTHLRPTGEHVHMASARIRKYSWPSVGTAIQMTGIISHDQSRTGSRTWWYGKDTSTADRLKKPWYFPSSYRQHWVIRVYLARNIGDVISISEVILVTLSHPSIYFPQVLEIYILFILGCTHGWYWCNPYAQFFEVAPEMVRVRNAGTGYCQCYYCC